MPKKRKKTTVAEQSGGVYVEGDAGVGRDLVGRDQYNITLILQMRGFTPPPDLAHLRRTYLDHLQRQYRALHFNGIPQLEALSRALLLEDVYVPLVARPELPPGEPLAREWRLAGRGFDREA